MVEAARKHGPFDRRYPLLRKLPPEHHRSEPAEASLDWAAFLARFFPGRRRHDLVAIAAYVSYVDGLERPAADAGDVRGERAL